MIGKKNNKLKQGEKTTLNPIVHFERLIERELEEVNAIQNDKEEMYEKKV